MEGSLLKHVRDKWYHPKDDPERRQQRCQLQARLLGPNPFKTNTPAMLLEVCVLYLENCILHASEHCAHCCIVPYMDIPHVAQRHEKASRYELVSKEDLLDTVNAIRDAFLAKNPDWGKDPYSSVKMGETRFRFDWIYK